MLRAINKSVLFLLLSVLPCGLSAQQIADDTYLPDIHNPAYEPGKGPVVCIDAGHHNFHTRKGRYQAFASLLERDGYIVKDYNGAFTMQHLAEGKILVISNALHKRNVRKWVLPTPSAFTAPEIEAVRQWVSEGGSLFLIADHMPMAGAAHDLAAVFGFECANGFAMDTNSRGPAVFSLEDKTLVKSTITRGRDKEENVDQVASFTGQAFTLPEDAIPILLFNSNYTILLPDTAWAFKDSTPTQNAKGWSQGAYKRYGKGKVVIFGEAAMFTAQLAGPQKIKMGMNNDIAAENHQLLLNIIHWLDGILE